MKTNELQHNPNVKQYALMDISLDVVWKQTDKKYHLKNANGDFFSLTRNERVERIASECLKLYDYYENTDTKSDYSLEAIPQNNELLVDLCTEVQYVLDTMTPQERSILKDTYQNELTREEFLAKYNVSTIRLVKPFRDRPLVKLAYYLVTTWHWDELGQPEPPENACYD